MGIFTYVWGRGILPTHGKRIYLPKGSASFSGSGSVRAGDSVTVTFTVSGSNIQGITAVLHYDSSALTLTGTRQLVGSSWSVDMSGGNLLAYDQSLSNPITGSAAVLAGTLHGKSRGAPRAPGACKQARDSSFQAIIPVRGKILNCLKAEYNKIFANDIITDLIKVLGCGVEVKSKSMKDMVAFNIDQLRWSKVIICTDADVDGFQIRTLILAMIYRLMPTLIEKGKVYIAESPLYEINSKDETWFAYNEQEKQDILSQLENSKFTIQRSKGLGENDADMMSLTTMNPATRRLIRVDPTDAQKTAEIFDLWLGDNLAGRKEHIARDGAAYIDMADVS